MAALITQDRDCFYRGGKARAGGAADAPLLGASAPWSSLALTFIAWNKLPKALDAPLPHHPDITVLGLFLPRWHSCVVGSVALVGESNEVGAFATNLYPMERSYQNPQHGARHRRHRPL